MIPIEKHEAVERGLLAAFGTSVMDEVRVLDQGLSSDLVYRVVVNGTPYLLKVMMRMDERNDPVRIFGAMCAAAEAGVAPRVWYANRDDGVLITDFVKAVALDVSNAVVLIPEAVRRLHELAPFPKAFNYVTSHNLFIWRFRNAGLLSDEVAEVYAAYERLCAVYPRLDADMVSSHCDLKPENVLFDGTRVWLVDWQAAFLNDRYFDLAVVANFVVEDDAAYLRTYFGRAADGYELARFFLMRQALHLFYAAVFMLLSGGEKSVGESVSFREFHRRIWAGEVSLASHATRVRYARVHWERLLENLRSARFDEAIRVVSERPAERLLFPQAPVIAR